MHSDLLKKYGNMSRVSVTDNSYDFVFEEQGNYSHNLKSVKINRITGIIDAFSQTFTNLHDPKNTHLLVTEFSGVCNKSTGKKF